MKMLAYPNLWLLIAAALLCGCARDSSNANFYQPSKEYSPIEDRWPAVLKTHDYPKIHASAIAKARADIASGNPWICMTGGIAVYAVGVPEKYQKEVMKLPQVSLPSGCTAPFLGEAMEYAEAYNREIVEYLQAQEK